MPSETAHKDERLRSGLLSFAVFFATVLALPGAHGHPVSFEGAWSIMTANKGAMHDIDVFHSFTPRFAAGGSYLKSGDDSFSVVRANLLLRRWNREDSQGNLYLSVGAGGETSPSTTGPDRHGEVGVGEVMADWEDRRLYVLAKHRVLVRESRADWARGNVEMSQLRAGFAPYLGEYNQLNTWVIGQLDQGPTSPRDFTLLLRFYYNNVLWEIGSSLNHQTVFNFMVHL